MKASTGSISNMLASALAFAFIASVEAATYSTNTTEGLIYLLETYDTTDTVIELEEGDYPMPAEPAYTNSTVGYASIRVHRQRLRGKGASPADVRLIGTGQFRVVFGDGSPVLENLTITGGHAPLYQGNTSSKRGGGYYGTGTLTNCIVRGNSADGPGGGVQAKPKLYDCIVEDNQSKASGGGGAHDVTAYRTIFRNNFAYTDGGGAYSVTLYDCVVSNNVAGNNGGGGYNVRYATNTLFAGNLATNYAGAAGNINVSRYGNVLVDCVISNNWCNKRSGGLHLQTAVNCTIVGNSGSFGGGACECSFTNCIIKGNEARSATAAYQGGGGAFNCALVGCTLTDNFSYGHGGGAFENTGTNMIVDCTFARNMASNDLDHAYGGGLCIDVGFATNCTFYGNAALAGYNASKDKYYRGTGGGAGSDKGTGGLVGCVLHDNSAAYYGGGARSLTMKDCIVSNNWSDSYGPNVYECRMTGCEVVGSGAAYGWAVGTTFHDIGGTFTVEGNPWRSGSFQPVVLYRPYPNCTNCLFVGNRLSATSSLLFGAYNTNSSTIASSLVNCTIVSNDCVYMFRYFAQQEVPMRVENCIFYENGDRVGANRRDMTTTECTTNALRFAYCAYSLNRLKDDNGNGEHYNTSDWFDAGDWHLGANGLPANPGFAGAKDPAHPFCLRTSSPLLGLAPVADWMADACDIRGEGFPRLRDGKADLGCYQCWYDFIGTTIIIR